MKLLPDSSVSLSWLVVWWKLLDGNSRVLATFCHGVSLKWLHALSRCFLIGIETAYCSASGIRSVSTTFLLCDRTCFSCSLRFKYRLLITVTLLWLLLSVLVMLADISIAFLTNMNFCMALLAGLKPAEQALCSGAKPKSAHTPAPYSHFSGAGGQEEEEE